jgi:hypothetical protein
MACYLLKSTQKKGGIMAEKRQHMRIDCMEKCLLFHGNTKYITAITNISISGVLVNLPRSASFSVLPGDTCGLELSSHPEASFCSYKGRITHSTFLAAGIEILEHDF